MNQKLSQLQDFSSKPLLYAAQKRGAAIAGLKVDFATIHIIGLAEILWEGNIGNIRSYASSAEEIRELITPKPTKELVRKKWWQFG